MGWSERDESLRNTIRNVYRRAKMPKDESPFISNERLQEMLVHLVEGYEIVASTIWIEKDLTLLYRSITEVKALVDFIEEREKYYNQSLDDLEESISEIPNAFLNAFDSETNEEKE